MTFPVPRRPGDKPQYLCKRCGRLFDTYRQAERHMDLEHGAGRIESTIVLKDEQR